MQAKAKTIAWLGLFAAFASGAAAAPMPASVQGRWTDQEKCELGPEVMHITSNTLEVWKGETRQGVLEVNAKGNPATRLEVKVTKATALSSGAPKPGDVLVMKLDGGKLRLIETITAGRHVVSQPHQQPLTRCS